MAESPTPIGTMGHTTTHLLLLYNNDLFTVQTRDEQEETKTKVKTNPIKLWTQTDQTVKGTTKYSVSTRITVGRRPTNDGARSRSLRSRFMRAHEPYLPGSLPHTTLWHQHILAYLKVRQYISNASLQACFSKTRSLSFGSLIWKCHSTGQMWRFKY